MAASAIVAAATPAALTDGPAAASAAPRRVFRALGEGEDFLQCETSSAGEGPQGASLKGLLISLLTLFDVNRSGSLTQEEFSQAAAPVGFKVSDEAWAALCARFGNELTSEVAAAAGESDAIDLSLFGTYFSNRYDALLEELLRRLMCGVVNCHAKNVQLERRLRSVEDHLAATSIRVEQERRHKIQRTLRRWRHQYTSLAFDGWRALVAHRRERVRSALNHWRSATLLAMWRRWRSYLLERQRVMATAGQVVARMRNELLARCMDEWRSGVSAILEARRATLAQAALRIANLGLARAMSTWR